MTEERLEKQLLNFNLCKKNIPKLNKNIPNPQRQQHNVEVLHYAEAMSKQTLNIFNEDDIVGKYKIISKNI